MSRRPIAALLNVTRHLSKLIFDVSIRAAGKQMRNPLPDLEQQRSLFPLFPSNLVGLRKIPGKHLLHFSSELAAQNNRVHLVIA